VAKKAFERYIERGTGGWIGFHHAMLLVIRWIPDVDLVVTFYGGYSLHQLHRAICYGNGESGMIPTIRRPRVCRALSL